MKKQKVRDADIKQKLKIKEKKVLEYIYFDNIKNIGKNNEDEYEKYVFLKIISSLSSFILFFNKTYFLFI